MFISLGITGNLIVHKAQNLLCFTLTNLLFLFLIYVFALSSFLIDSIAVVFGCTFNVCKKFSKTLESKSS